MLTVFTLLHPIAFRKGLQPKGAARNFRPLAIFLVTAVKLVCIAAFHAFGRETSIVQSIALSRLGYHLLTRSYASLSARRYLNYVVEQDHRVIKSRARAIRASGRFTLRGEPFSASRP
jgi:hypothetical protein